MEKGFSRREHKGHREVRGTAAGPIKEIAPPENFAPLYTMAFDYGQRDRHELTAAAALAEKAGVKEHRVVTIDLRAFGGSALTSDTAVPKDRNEGQMSAGVPITYVPARNTIF